MLTPVERLLLLNQYRILEIIDPEKSREYDRDAEACELGTLDRIAELFDGVIDIEPTGASSNIE